MNMNIHSRQFLPLCAFLSITLWTIGCAQQATETNSSDSPSADSARSVTVEPPSLEELGNATYSDIENEPVTLVGGLWEGAPYVEGGASAPSVGLVRGFHRTGDLDQDGQSETVALLWSSSGGSGTFNYVVATSRDEAGIAVLGLAELGDRVQVRDGRVVEGRVELDVVQAGPDDAACCPTEMATRTWEMGPEGLVEKASEKTGTLSLDALRGAEWLLTDLAWNEPAPSEPAVTLVLDEDKIVGDAGCNSYFAAVVEDVDMPADLSIEGIGATGKMCPEEIMAIEDRYLKQLASVSSYGYLAGKLALSWQTDDSGGVMLFIPRESSKTDS